MKTTDASITNPENKFDLHSNSGFAGFAYLWQYTLLLLTVCSLFACESLVDDLNVDPKNPTTASPNLMLTGAQVANILVHEGEIARRAGMWSGYFTGVFLQYDGYINSEQEINIKL